MDGFHWPDGIGATYDDIVILGGKRTPFGGFCKSLARVTPTDLGILAGRAAIEEAGIQPGDLDQVIFANVAQSSADAYYLPRHIALYCGVPTERPALLVQRICGSGLEAIIHAAEQISLGKAEVVLAGGAENMTLNPLSSFGARLGHGLGDTGFVDTLWESLLDPATGCTMGQTAENLATKYGLTREEVDEFAQASQERCFAATERGFFVGEIVPVSSCVLEAEGLKPRKVRLPRGVEELAADEHPRRTKPEKLAKLPPVFGKEGVQTAGNSSGIVDGGAAVVVASAAAAKRLNAQPMGRLLASASAGVPPEIMGIGPAPVIRKLYEISGNAQDDIDCYEINEAFGAQCLAVLRELELDHAKLNVNGGAIAIGHPLAATGTRLTLTLLRQLTEAQQSLGIASACIGGGQGTALLVGK